MTTISRRSFMATSGVGLAVAVTGLGTQLAYAQSSANGSSGDTLVVVFLRGGADGLSMAPPYGYSSYRQLRPNIAVPPPGQNGGALPLNSSNGNAAFPTGIDGVVGLHPALKPIHDTLWAQGKLAVIPAVGMPASESSTRSHFSAQDYIEAGSASPSVGGSWLSRLVNSKALTGPVPALSMGRRSDLIKGAVGAVTVPRLAGFGIGGFSRTDMAKAALQTLYRGDDSVAVEGKEFLDIVDRFNTISEETRPGYPNHKLGRSFSELSALLKAGLGVQVAAIDMGGWDHHSNLGRSTDPGGRFNARAGELAGALRAFGDDTNGLDGITVMVITEFGRTINENGNLGTDHGRAATYLAMGAGIRGGVYGDDFPDEIKDDPNHGDLSVLTDFRKPLGEIAQRRAGISNMNLLFPTYQGGVSMGLTR